MKRLLWYLNQITDNQTTTFRYQTTDNGNPVQKEIYDGECNVIYLKPGGDRDGDREGIRREPVYWRDGISYAFERTSRTAPDRPTVIIAIPADRLGVKDCTPAAADYCLRAIAPYFDRVNAQYANRARPDSDNGRFYVYRPGGEVLVRNSAYFAKRPAKDYENGSGATIFVTRYVDAPPDATCLCVRVEVQLPHGKLKRMRKILTGHLPDETERFVREFDGNGLSLALELEVKQNAIRKFIRDNGYCAFIANGSVLARDRGTDLPMEDPLPFTSAPEDEITAAGVRGMGIRRGVTVITGGGYSGKSTVLNAVSAGVVNHVAGDGRELCLTDESAVTVTAEDGRSVSRLNVSPFIKWAAGGDATDFSTAHASGSTSQAANIIEAVSGGSGLLLIDEDRSATNFMIRDALMKKLIKKEPITPFTDRVRELSERGVSTILVIGGSGEYLSAADKVYMMEDFSISEITAAAKELAPAAPKPPDAADWSVRRAMRTGGFSTYPEGSGSEKLGVSDTGFIIMGDERIDVRTLHDIKTAAQVNALAFMLRYLSREACPESEMEILAAAMRGIDRKPGGREADPKGMVRRLYEQIGDHGLNLVDTGFFPDMGRFMDMPREYELLAAIYRMRGVEWAAGPRPPE